MSKTGLSREAERHKPLTATDRLRQLLNDMENQLGALARSSAEEALSLPAMLDDATSLLAAGRAKGATLQAEEVRLNTIMAQFERKAGAFMRIVGQARLAAARPAGTPEDVWWWYPDRIEAERQRARNARLLRTGAVVAFIGAVLVVVYQLFLAPDPLVIERLNRINNAEALAEEGRFEAAIGEIQLAQTAMPDDPFALLMEGAYHEQMGAEQTADQLFSRAKSLTESETDFLLQRAQVYLRLGAAEVALEDLDTILERDSESAVAYYLRGAAYEGMNDLGGAYDSYMQAVELAEEQGDSRLSGMGRVQLAYLTQRMMAGQPTPVMTPTP